MKILERYEWTNLWWDEPANTGKRILLVGDSIANGYRPCVKENMDGGFYIDLLATSKAVDNFDFTLELSYVLERGVCRYDAVHFNNGLHGFHMNCMEYAKHYERVLEYLICCLGTERVFLALSTPITKEGNALEYSEKNAVVLERNDVVTELAAKYGICVNNLYDAVVGKPDIRLDDGFHYNDAGQKLLGKTVAEFLMDRQ